MSTLEKELNNQLAIELSKSMYKKNKVWKTILKYFLYTLPLVIFVFPLFVLITRSFFTTSEITSLGAGLFPKIFSVDSYKQVFQDRNFFIGLKNTLIIVACNVIGVPLTAFMSAYAFTKVKFRGRKAIFTVALGTIMIPGILLMLPCYKIFVDIGWYDTLLPLTVPCFFGGGIINIFMIMQFMRSIPKSVDEAAILDGASIFRRMFQITLPLISPIMIFLAVSSFFAAWNDLMGPLLYVMSEENYTVNMYIYEKYLLSKEIEYQLPNVQMGYGVILMIPMLVVFIIFQKYLISGLTFGAVKE